MHSEKEIQQFTEGVSPSKQLLNGRDRSSSKSSAPPPQGLLDDQNYMDALTHLLVEEEFGKQCWHLLKAGDFKPLHGIKYGRARWIVAEYALNSWHKYGKPPGQTILTTVLGYAKDIGMGSEQIQELDEYVKYVRHLKVINPQQVVDMVLGYKHGRGQYLAINNMLDLQSSGQLTVEKMEQLVRVGRT